MPGDLELQKEEVSCGARVGAYLSLSQLLIATRRDILPCVPHLPPAMQGLWNRHSRVFWESSLPAALCSQACLHLLCLDLEALPAVLCANVEFPC